FAVFVDVETGDFHLLGRTQANQRFCDISNYNRAHYEQHQRNADGFNLFPQLRLEDVIRHINLFETGVTKKRGEVWISRVTGEHAGHDRTAHSTDAVNAPRIQRVVHAEPAF